MLSTDDEGHYSLTAMEKGLFLFLVLKCYKKVTLKFDQIREFERKIWLSYIHFTNEQKGQDKQPLGEYEYIWRLCKSFFSVVFCHFCFVFSFEAFLLYF